MNPNINIVDFLDRQDTAVATALVAGLGNFALTQAVNGAVAHMYAQIALERDAERDSALDDRNDKDDTQNLREPPSGMEARETPLERTKRFGALYVACVNRATALGAGQYDMPQDITGHVTWRAGLPDKEKARARRTTDLNEALRLASRAKANKEFWDTRAADIISIVHDACEFGSLSGDEAAESALFAFGGVDAVQAMIKAHGRLVDRINNRKSSPYFTAKGAIGDEIRSDVGAMESSLTKSEEFIARLEAEYAHEIIEAVNIGRRLDTLESATAAIETRQRARLAEMLAD